MTLRLGLFGIPAFDEDVAFRRHTFVEGFGRRDLDAVDTGKRCQQAARTAFPGFAHFGEDLGVGVGDGKVADLAKLSTLSDQLLRIGDGAFGQIARDDFVDDA